MRFYRRFFFRWEMMSFDVKSMFFQKNDGRSFARIWNCLLEKTGLDIYIDRLYNELDEMYR